jgi:hypothetical protein
MQIITQEDFIRSLCSILFLTQLKGILLLESQWIAKNVLSSCLSKDISIHADGNPVTGEGYTAANDSPSPPASTTTNGKGSAEIRRNRVPPGGYSSGLW